MKNYSFAGFIVAAILASASVVSYIKEKSGENNTISIHGRTSEEPLVHERPPTRRIETESVESREALSAIKNKQDDINHRLLSLENLVKEKKPLSNVPQKENHSERTDFPDPVILFEDRYLLESQDVEWSGHAEESISDALFSIKELNVPMANDAVECLSTLCKVSYQLVTEDTFEDVVDMININIPWEARSYTEYTISDKGTIEVVGYYMRENHDFPRAID